MLEYPCSVFCLFFFLFWFGLVWFFLCSFLQILLAKELLIFKISWNGPHDLDSSSGGMPRSDSYAILLGTTRVSYKNVLCKDNLWIMALS
ncbi:hypothetical protein MANES_03G121416v8 [Manihot esculenta]|uniref:Uncharacterized protein n=1 Tax=Manihot esculenta TaxID=3983 RepID=A0ACB7I108_MANES|nr:hypothetical protein MANES_03G121416v8 [Manihot esculenta]